MKLKMNKERMQFLTIYLLIYSVLLAIGGLLTQIAMLYRDLGTILVLIIGLTLWIICSIYWSEIWAKEILKKKTTWNFNISIAKLVGIIVIMIIIIRTIIRIIKKRENRK